MLLPGKAESFSALTVMMTDAEDELTKAAATGNTDGVRFLLSKGVDVNIVNRFGRTPIQVMMMGNTPLAQLLLEHGADPNVHDPGTGSTPLHDAARTGFIDTVKLLICFSANPNATDRNNLRPVDVARQTGHFDVVEYLSGLYDLHRI